MSLTEFSQGLSVELGRNISEKKVAGYETGEAKLKADTLRAMAVILGVSSDELLGLPHARRWQTYHPHVAASVSIDREDYGTYSRPELYATILRFRDGILKSMVLENKGLRGLLVFSQEKVLDLMETLRKRKVHTVDEGPRGDGIGARMRYYRQRADLTMGRLAAALSDCMDKGYNTNMVTKYELGEVMLSAQMIKCLTGILNVTSDELLGLAHEDDRINGLLDFGDIAVADTDAIGQDVSQRERKQKLLDRLSLLYDTGDALAREGMHLRNRSLQLSSLIRSLERELEDLQKTSADHMGM